MSRIRLVLLVVLFAVVGRAQAAQSFDSLTCQSDIPKALLGRTMPNGRVSAIEARYKHLFLKDLGAFGVEDEGDPWTLISWRICGREHVILERHNVVRDVLVPPPEAGKNESAVVSCSVDGVVSKEAAVIFGPVAPTRAPVQVQMAWFIDDHAIKFTERHGAKILCKDWGT
jgi:hypothetical protein